MEGLGRYWSIPEKVEAVLDACDGTRTIGQLLESFHGLERGELIQIIQRLLPTGQVALIGALAR